MGADGSCPSCGRVLPANETGGAVATATKAPKRAPWHFKLMVVAVSGYLGWRLVQGISWVVHHI
jgi:hypothetical protein